MASKSTNVVWAPDEGSQSLALSSDCRITFYTGTRGPGKTDCQLMHFRKNVGVGYGSYWRGIIFDREYKNLDDIVRKTRLWFSKFDDGAKFYSSKGDFKWVWPTGEELLIRAAYDEADYWNYHGHEYPWIAWNELTKYANSKLFNMMMSTNRSSFVVPIGSNLQPIPLQVFITSNPYGPGHTWVKQRFIDVAPYGRIHINKIPITNPMTMETKEVEMSQVAIFGHWSENSRITLDYIAGLMVGASPAQIAAWMYGSWDHMGGGAFDDVFRRSVHVIPRFVIPSAWKVDRCFDWGSSHPFYVGWCAEADGHTEALIVKNGKEYSFCPPKKSLIFFNEWYGTHKIGTNDGIKIGPSAIASGILERERKMKEYGYISTNVRSGPADNQIFATTNSEEETIASRMQACGVDWERATKGPNSRKARLELTREAMRNATATIKEGPAIYFTENCVAAIATIPVLPRDEKDPDDVDTDAEDHPYDAISYKVASVHSKVVNKNVNVSWN